MSTPWIDRPSQHASQPRTFPVIQEDQYNGVTGKGLDIDDIKMHTVASQFLHVEHSGLDPYGSSITDVGNGTGGVPQQGCSM
jgi:hypothetical protein